MSFQTCFNSFRSRSTVQLAHCLCLQVCPCLDGNYTSSPNTRADRQAGRETGRETGKPRKAEWSRITGAATWRFIAYTVQILNYYKYERGFFVFFPLFDKSFQDHDELQLIQSYNQNAAVAV